MNERRKMGTEYSTQWRERVDGQTGGEARPRTKRVSNERNRNNKKLVRGVNVLSRGTQIPRSLGKRKR